MARLTEFLVGLIHSPEGEVIPAGTDFTPYYQPWGFTIYLTAYGGLQFYEHWQALLDAIRANVIEQINGPDGRYQAEPVAQHILSLFHLDVRDRPPVLAGLRMEHLRVAFKNENGGRPMNADRPERRCFLFVDKAVMEAYAAMADSPTKRPWFKRVEVDYVADDHIPRNTRLGGQRYFGWMKVSIDSVPQLWSLLEVKWLVDIAPPAPDGVDPEVWHCDADF